MSAKSRKICHAIKGDGPGPKPSERMIDFAVRRLFEEMPPDLMEILSPRAIMVPAPKSAPFPPRTTNVLWVPRRICEAFHGIHLGNGWTPCIERTEAVPRSASSARGQRPIPARHYATLKVNTMLLPDTDRVVIVDDVITLGSTAIAAASRLQDAMPDAEVSVFALIRTCGLVPDVERIVDPVVGTVSLTSGGRPQRIP